MESIKEGYNSILELIQTLNQSSSPYVILRNYENLLEESLYMDGHGDIDLLCCNSVQLAKDLNALPHKGHFKNGVHDKVHFFIYLNKEYVSLDLRFVGDGYYCRKWQEDILKRRVLHNGFYVMGELDYFYSLIYHAVFQKNIFSEDYKNRLTIMAKKLGIEVKEESIVFFVSLLEKFMDQNNYTYVYPTDKHVPLNIRLIQNINLLQSDFKLWWLHWKYNTKNRLIEKLVCIKHKFFR